MAGSQRFQSSSLWLCKDSFRNTKRRREPAFLFVMDWY